LDDITTKRHGTDTSKEWDTTGDPNKCSSWCHQERERPRIQWMEGMDDSMADEWKNGTERIQHFLNIKVSY
jgi:hypothetical protein